MKRCAHFSRRAIEKENGHEGVALISIRDPGSPRPSFRNPWVEVLELEFHDISANPQHLLTRWGMPDEYERQPIVPSMQHAKRIAEFIRKHEGRSIFVHCEAGISRSAAVCEALHRLGWEYWQRHGFSYELRNALLLRLLAIELKLEPTEDEWRAWIERGEARDREQGG